MFLTFLVSERRLEDNWFLHKSGSIVHHGWAGLGGGSVHTALNLCEDLVAEGVQGFAWRDGGGVVTCSLLTKLPNWTIDQKNKQLDTGH